MARIRSQNEIVSGLLDFFRIAQPGLDTKPGSVGRDLAIEGISIQFARLYDEVNRVSTLQSLRLALGIDLDRLGDNFGIKRNRGSYSTGPSLLTFNNLDIDISINKGDIIYAKNGATFAVVNATVVNHILANQYKATVARFRSDLDFIGITDQYAVEVLCQATATGVQGNISKFSLSHTSISGINNVTNVVAFGGGNGVEDDTAFRNRILAIFSGANTGTTLGYKNAVSSDPAVIDAIVIKPGDPLMTRDGTQVKTDSTGKKTIISEGSGGKVDICIFGVRIQEALDSFIYRDSSNTGDPTHPKNDFVLGQIAADAGKTVTRKRLDNLENGVLPNQPVNNIIEVSGSISGANYVEKTVDHLGRVKGNFELLKDIGAFGGSPWGFDRLRWIKSFIEDFPEDKTKQIFNGQDSLGFPDVLKINSVVQNIPVTNENSKVSASDRSIIQLAHSPCTNVTRVFNSTTGERYSITNQNPTGSGNINTSGKITISGRSLPAVSDILQVDYTWVFSYDPYFDFDNRVNSDNPRSVTDSIDWGLSNAVRREKATLMANGSYLSVSTIHPISSVINVNVFSTSDGEINISSGRIALIVPETITNVVSIIRISDGAELWNTNKSDGSFSGQTIFFPSDSPAVYQDDVSVTFNTIDVFNTDNPGSFNGNMITIVPSTIAEVGVLVECNYIANISTILPTILLNGLPVVRSGNAFSTSNGSVIGTQPTTHLFDSTSIIANLRQAPSNLGLTITGSISPGVITVTGSTITGIFDAVFTVANTGLKQDLLTVLKKALGLNSKNSLPSNIRVIRINKVEKVLTTSSLEVLNVTHSYDIKGYYLYDNSFVKTESIVDDTLKLTEFILPETSENIQFTPSAGDRLRVSFHYAISNDSENVSFSKSGTLYTNKKFALVDTVAVSSGFTSAASSTATLTVSNLNQPLTRTRYKVSYDYIAPKVNERINIRFNVDKLIGDATFAIENTRPINADVLVKSSVPIIVDVIMKISVTEEFENSYKIVIQDVKDTITAALNATALNTKIDASDLIHQAYTVSGVDSARILFFNKTGITGSVLSIKAEKNEFIRANNVDIGLEDG